ncbi:hypothetical protein ABID95_007145 [Streptomyces atratus]
MTSKSHKQVRAGVEHVFARMKTWKILRDCRLKGDGVQRLVMPHPTSAAARTVSARPAQVTASRNSVVW